jgi:DNA-binding MarR family transcriptional regulator
MNPAARESVRLSLGLLTTGRLVEREADAMLRARFGATLARFDFLAALERYGPLTLGEVSGRLLVSNGNVTGLAARLKADGLIEARAGERDRRVQTARLTPRGESVFKRMAKAHAACVDHLLGDLAPADKQALTRLLDGVKASLRRKLDREAAP